jgi:hypothetical protein
MDGVNLFAVRVILYVEMEVAGLAAVVNLPDRQSIGCENLIDCLARNVPRF